MESVAKETSFHTYTDEFSGAQEADARTGQTIYSSFLVFLRFRYQAVTWPYFSSFSFCYHA
jgi:hypothetical protein